MTTQGLLSAVVVMKVIMLMTVMITMLVMTDEDIRVIILRAILKGLTRRRAILQINAEG